MKKTAQKRILAITLTICMVISLVPAAFAVSAEDFTDVSPAAWYYDSVDYVADHGYFSGIGDGLFSPDTSMTRAMFVTVLARLNGADTDNAAAPFDDVAAGAWYAGAVAWAAENGVAGGIGGNKFAPDEAVSRQQMAAFTARYIAYYAKKHNVTFKATGAAADFHDADKIADYAAEAVTLCHSYGLVNGTPEGNFDPDAQSTRAQVAAVIYRLALLLETGAKAAPPRSGGSGGGSSSTSAANSAGTAAGFIEAAQKNADYVTATVEQTNSITVNDDIALTNDSVRTLTLDLASASAGNLTVNAANAAQINIKGEEASVSSLTINAPKATVTNNVPVNGSVTIQAVSNSTFNNTAVIKGNITMTGPGAISDTQAAPVPVVIATDEEVTVRGNSASISITADGAKVTLDTAAEIAPAVSSSAKEVAVSVKTAEETTISGTVAAVTTTAGDPKLAIEGTVGKLDVKGAQTVALSGGGTVDALTAADTAVTVPKTDAKITIASAEMSGGSLSAPVGAVDTVKASGAVELKASVNKVEAEKGTTLSVAEDATVNTVAAAGELTLAGNGAVGQVDVAADGAATITVAKDVAVSTVNNTGDGKVTMAGDNEEAKALTVTAKAAPPSGLTYEAPTTASGKGTILNVSALMEYKGGSITDWTAVTEDSLSVAAGNTYQIRVKATSEKLASEPVAITAPAVVGVTDAAIQGKPYVGQTLTAVANAGATGTLSYVWKAGDSAISGAAGKTLTLTDGQVGKTITVTISNYSDATDASDATAAVTVDKTALSKLIAKAAEVQQGVAARDSAASAVAKGIIFVTNAEKTALTTAVTAAGNANTDGAKTAAVSAQETALRAAIETYEKAKKVGTFDKVEVLKDELGTLITAATAAQVKNTDTDADNVAPSESWVTNAVQTTYTNAIAAATTVKDNSGATADELAKGIADLNAAMSVYQKAIQSGAALDNTALLAAINAAELNAASVSVSADGKDVLPSQSWVAESVMTAYTTAIGAAKSTDAEMQKTNTAALATLDTATDTFDKAKAPGTKDIVAPIVTGVKAEAKEGEEGKFTISFTSDEAGSYQYQYGSTDGDWTTGSAVTADSSKTFDYTPAIPGAMLYIQVSDESGNATIAQVKVGKEPADAEASIGSVKYETFEKAVEAAAAGQTVKLLTNVETEAIITLTKDLTLDTNGQTLTRGGTLTPGTDTRIFLITGGTTTLTGGGTLTIENCATMSENGMLRVNDGAALVVNDVTVKTSENVYYAIGPFGGAVTVNEGATIHSPRGSAIVTNGSDNWPAVAITINGGTISSGTAYAMYLPGKSQTVNITGGTITGGMEVKGGTVNISGGEITANGTDQTHDANGNGNSTTGYAVALVENSGYQKDESTVSVNISGGKITGAVAEVQDSERDGEETLAITGGTFSTDPSAYVVDGYKATQSGGVWTVALKTEPDENDVASVGGRFFTTLQGAFDAARDGDTVKLLTNVENEAIITLTKTLTLDTDTHTLTRKGTDECQLFYIGSGTTTLTGGGTLTNTEMAASKWSFIEVSANGNLVVDNVTIENKQNVDSIGLFGGTLTVNEGATIHTTEGWAIVTNGSDNWPAVAININGGTISSGKEYAMYLPGKSQTVNITGGTITSGMEVKGGTVNISGGEITANGTDQTHDANGNGNSTTGYAVALAENKSYQKDGGAVSVNISGGTITGAVIKVQDSERDGEETLAITGGTFSTDPTEYVAGGYEATEDNGVWTVAANAEADET